MRVSGCSRLAASELHDLLRPGVSIFFQQVEVKAQSLAPMADRDHAYGRDPVMAIPALQDGSLSPRRERSPDQGSEHDAEFIEENNVDLSDAAFS
jgi:hypothetical protein